MSVKRALQNCCQQLKAQLTQRNAIKDAKSRRSKLIRYVPDVSRSLFSLLDGMRQRHEQNVDRAKLSESPHKRLRLDANVTRQIIQKLDQNQITEGTIHSLLIESIDVETPTTGTLLHMPGSTRQIFQKLDQGQITEGTIHSLLIESIDVETPTTGTLLHMPGSTKNDITAIDAVTKATTTAALLPSTALYMIPLFNFTDDTHDVKVHPLLTFRPIVPLQVAKASTL